MNCAQRHDLGDEVVSNAVRRTELAIAYRGLWQAKVRAGNGNLAAGDDGVFAIHFDGHTANLFWFGFVPVAADTGLDVAASAAAQSAPLGHFCGLQLFSSNLTTAEGVLLCARALDLVSQNWQPDAGSTRVDDDPLTAMLRRLEPVAATSNTPAWMHSLTDLADDVRGAPARINSAEVMAAVTTAVGAPVSAQSMQVLAQCDRGTVVVRVGGDQIIKVETRSTSELDMLERLAAAGVPHVMLPVRSYRDVPSGGSTLVFPVLLPCPLRLAITEFAAFAYPLLKACLFVSFACILAHSFGNRRWLYCMSARSCMATSSRPTFCVHATGSQCSLTSTSRAMRAPEPPSVQRRGWRPSCCGTRTTGMRLR